MSLRPSRAVIIATTVALTGALVLAPIAGASTRASAQSKDRRAFHAAIRDASVPQRREIDDHLFALSDSNHWLVWRKGRQEVQVVAVMTRDTYRSFYKSGSGTTPASKPVVWVTLAPQLRKWCRKLQHRANASARHRVIQRLGLSPTTPYSRVVDLWVDRGDVFRPCPDPAPGDRSCNLRMHGTPQVRGIADYPTFFASLYVGAYQVDGAPWTRLGYTYDWGGSPRRDVGESEYMLTTSTKYVVARSASIPAYCSR